MNTMEIHWTKNLDSEIYRDALNIRYEVFIDEQHVPEELEIDDLESTSIHGVLYRDKKAIATVRVYPIEANKYKIQRVAVLKEYRSQGVGRLLMQEVENKIKCSKDLQLILDSQNYAIPFYERLGYQISSSEFMDAGIPHHTMVKNI